MLISLLAALVGIVMLSVICNAPKETQTIVQYEVTISQDVSFKEFNEKYKIIEQRGEIYVIQEREEKE